MIKLPDILEIKPLKAPPTATITVPGSKSITNRALILAALADGKCTLRGALWADDTQVMLDSLQRLGFVVKVSPDPTEECNRTIEVTGQAGKIPAKKAELHVGNAGTAARFLTALVCLGEGEYRISGDPRMHERPMKELFHILRQFHVEVESADDHLPAIIRSKHFHGTKVLVSPRESSQFASALILISKHGEIEVNLEGLEDAYGYITMTRRMVEDFTPQTLAERGGIYGVEPDASSASYFIAANHLLGGQITIRGWSKISLQEDSQFASFLPPPAHVTRTGDLGDSVMTLAICALFGKQSMTLRGARRMRLQECDRLKAMVTELKRVGANTEETEDGFIVHPAKAGQLHGADIETYNDHRMAMCFAVLGLKVPGIRIKNPKCVTKTFPNFFDKLKQIGAELVDATTGKQT